MKTLNRLSDRAYNYASKQTFFFMLFFLVTILITMQFGTNGMKKFDSTAEMLDMSNFGYSVTAVYGLLTRLGATGRLIYIQQLGIDILFAVIFALFQSVMISGLIKRSHAGDRWKILNLLPFLRSLLDLIENGLLLYIIIQFPVEFPALATAASLVTISKWIIYYLVMAALISLGVYLTSKSLPKGKLSPKAN
jgi:hypothetical protein